MNKKGFTLIEVLVAMGIFALIIGTVVWIFIYSLRYNAVLWEQLKTQTDGRRVLQEVVDDARRAEQSSIGSFAIVTADEYELSFYANIDNDSLREKIRFWIDDGDITLKKGVIKPTGNPLEYVSGNETVVEIAHDVVNRNKSIPLFLYYDEKSYPTSNALLQPVALTDVSTVKVQLELEEDPNETPIPLHVESTVHIRSLKTN
jgi:prepilin-type N-terminal cleavage/methylation domain-containing protein